MLYKLKRSQKETAAEQTETPARLATPNAPYQSAKADNTSSAPTDGSVEANFSDRLGGSGERKVPDTQHPRIFGGEEVACYTTGSPKVITVNDSAKACVALLPDLDLAEKLQHAVLQDRDLTEAERECDEKLGQLHITNKRLARAIEDTEARIAKLQQDNIDIASNKIHKLHTKLENLQQKKSDVDKQMKACNQSLTSKHMEMLYHIHLLLGRFDSMLVESKILQPENERDEQETDTQIDAPSTGLDDVREPLLADIDCGSDSGSDGLNVLDTEPDFGVAARLVSRFQSVQTRLRVMEHAFDSREERFDDEIDERSRMQEAGEDVESDSAFDLRQLRTTQRMARQITEEEEALESAKAAAVAAGVQLPGSDIESGFVDDVNDGYRVSWEADAVDSVNPKRVSMWARDVPEEDTEELAQADIDDWEAESVDISDSMSMVTDGPARKRIDRWRAACARIELDIRS